jgi:hypothetical protein
MKQPAATFLFALAGFFLGLMVQAIWSQASRSTIGSNRFALETSLQAELKAYHERHGAYPASLDEIKVDWLTEPERRQMLLSDFYYENRGDTFVLWWPRKLTEKD